MGVRFEHFSCVWVGVVLTSPSGIVVRPAFEQQHPKALQPFLPEVRAFMELCHYNILHPILRCVVENRTEEYVLIT